MARTITAANSVYMLAISGLYPVPQRLQGYSADAAFDTDATELAEVQMGVDGHLSVGFTPNATHQTISLQADSASIDIFEQWASSNISGRTALIASGIVSIPSTGKKYTLSNGILMSFPLMPGVGRVLKPRVATLIWESVLPANI